MAAKTPYISYVEDAEEDSGSSVEGKPDTRRYAYSEAPSSPFKEQPNTSKSRADKRATNRQSESSSPNLTDSDSTARSLARERGPRKEYERVREKEPRKKERRPREVVVEPMQRKVRTEPRAPKEREVKTVKKVRPTSLTQSKTVPVVQQYRRGRVDDPSCYGVPQQAAPTNMRPRAQTGHFSYHGGQQNPTPPIAHAGWLQSHQAAQSPYDLGSYPPHPHGGTPPSVVGIPSAPAPTASYFDTQMTAQQQHAHLRNRFERERPSSAMGFRQLPPTSYGYEEYEEEQLEPHVGIPRRPSRTKKQQIDEDRRKMPPPEFIPRPKSAIPPSSSIPFRPPPPQTPPGPRQKSRPPVARRGVGFLDQRGFDDEDFSGNGELFTDASPDPVHDRRALTRTRRPSVTYEQLGMDIMPAGRRSQRNSLYGNERALGTGGVSLEDDRYLDAVKYQDDVSGGPTVPLTAESLRKASTRAGGSRGSTRSSGSQEDSEHKRSNTTGITRSSSGETDNVTIKVSGTAVVRVQGAEIECIDGGEITFSSRYGGGSRFGSERASTVYQLEDSRSRVERKALPHRARAPSQSESQSRTYAPSHAPYDPGFSADDYI